RGKVVDLGTEFGLSVDERGGTAVRVFEGKVVASPMAGGEAVEAGLTLHEDQSARIDDRTVALKPRGAGGDDTRYVRDVVPPSVPPSPRSPGWRPSASSASTPGRGATGTSAAGSSASPSPTATCCSS